MLSITAIADKKPLNDLHEAVFGTEYPKDIGYVLQDDGKNVGIASMTVRNDVSTIEKVGVIPEERGKGKGDFFTRSLIFGLSQVSEKVRISYKSPYFYRFGFTDDENGMIAESSKIVFPCGCKEH